MHMLLPCTTLQTCLSLAPGTGPGWGAYCPGVFEHTFCAVESAPVAADSDCIWTSARGSCCSQVPALLLSQQPPAVFPPHTRQCKESFGPDGLVDTSAVPHAGPPSFRPPVQMGSTTISWWPRLLMCTQWHTTLRQSLLSQSRTLPTSQVLDMPVHACTAQPMNACRSACWPDALCTKAKAPAGLQLLQTAACLPAACLLACCPAESTGCKSDPPLCNVLG